jgi:hypothetical protein
VGTITPKFLKLNATLRHNEVDAWSLQLPGSHPMVPYLRTEGAGIIVTQRLANGSVRTMLSGPTSKPNRKRNAENPDGIVTITGVSDDIVLADAMAWGDPAHALNAQASSNDARVGPAETLMHAYVNANVGPGALSARRSGFRAYVTMGTNGAHGASSQKSPRFQNLLELLQELATLNSLRFKLVQVGSALVFQTELTTDATALVRLNIENGTLESEEVEASPPTVTRVIVAGQGEGTARTLIERTSSEATAAEASWGRVIEAFKDQRNTDVTAELNQAGDEAIEAGAGIWAIRASASDAQLMRYGQEWQEGDLVTVVLDGAEYPVQVTAAAMVVGPDAIKVGAAIGDVASLDSGAQLESRVTTVESRVGNLERNAEVGTQVVVQDDSKTEASLPSTYTALVTVTAGPGTAGSWFAGTLTIITDMATNGTRMVQTATQKTNGDQWVRTATDASTWTAWAKQATTAYVDPTITAVTAATAAATANTLAKRDGSGRFAVADPSATGDATNKGSVDTLLLSKVGAIKIQKFTASDNYTPTAGLIFCVVEVQGGGGAGGGCPAAASGQASAASGGGGGCYMRSTFTAAQITAALSGGVIAVTIGAGGTGVSAGTGNTGGTSSLGSLITAGGGSGGLARASSAAVYSGAQGGAGGAAGTCGNPYNHVPGGDGGQPFTGGQLGLSGFGGGSHFGGTTAAPMTVAAGQSYAGNAGTTYGGGGSGALAASTGGAQAGGAGAAGVLVITEYLRA